MEIFNPTKKHLVIWAILFMIAGISLLIFYNSGDHDSINEFLESITTRNIFETMLLIANTYILAYFITLSVPETFFKLPEHTWIQTNESVVYNKLVRDLIPEHLAMNGVDFRTHIADDYEYESKLFTKLEEQATELARDRSVEEIADVYEVLDTIVTYKNFSRQEIGDIKRDKFEKRGGFSKKIILEETL